VPGVTILFEQKIILMKNSSNFKSGQKRGVTPARNLRAQYKM
jgi:hypothetical protein